MNRTLSPVVAAAAIAALSLAACKKSDLMTVPPPQSKAPAASSDANAVMASTGAADRSTASQPTPPPSPQAPMLAMAYQLGLAVPADQVRPLMESHQEACERAGTDQCQVMAASADAEQGDRATASLTLRATPAWMRRRKPATVRPAVAE